MSAAQPGTREHLLGGVAINGPVSRFGSRHVILWARGRTHHVRDFAGPLSIKSVVRGRADWTTDEGRFAIDDASYVIVNEDQPYSIDIESEEPVETFCLFFRRGFLEEARRTLACWEDDLLDGPGLPARDRVAFESLRSRDPVVLSLLGETHKALARGRPPGGWLEESVVALADALLRAQADVRRQMARIPAARPATRSEVYRRLRRAVDFVEGSLALPLDLEGLAGAACLSVYHFHRRFTEAFGETPHEYVRRRRLETARDLLETTRLPVTVVCHRTGFQSLGSFSALFRRRFGVPPLRYRRGSAPNRKI
jgi:AraC-like DNA-binding protein